MNWGWPQLSALLRDTVGGKISRSIWVLRVEFFFLMGNLLSSLRDEKYQSVHTVVDQSCRCDALRKNSSLIREARSRFGQWGKLIPVLGKFISKFLLDRLQTPTADPHTNSTILACFIRISWHITTGSCVCLRASYSLVTAEKISSSTKTATRDMWGTWAVGWDIRHLDFSGWH